MQGGRPPQPSATNSPSSSRALHGRPVGVRQSKRCATARVARSAPWAAREPRGSAPRERDHGGGDRPVPFRTRKLSPPSPKVLRGSPREDRASRSRRALFCRRGARILRHLGKSAFIWLRTLSSFGHGDSLSLSPCSFHSRLRCITIDNWLMRPENDRGVYGFPYSKTHRSPFAT